jgi:glutamate racemase
VLSTPTSPIGVFDSGVGGLSILREIRRRQPHERLIYVADSGFAPYGDRETDFIETRADAIVRFLIAQGVKAIVVACNTATGVAVERLRMVYALPIIAIEPPVKPAAAVTRSGVVGVLATRATLASSKFATLVGQHARQVRIIVQPCPGLAKQVEGGDLTSPATKALVDRYVLPLVQQGADALVIGCTHYSFLTPLISQAAGVDIAILDPAPAVARELHRRLQAADLLAPAGADSDGSVETFWSSGTLESVTMVMRELWGPQTIVLPLPTEYRESHRSSGAETSEPAEH